MQGPNAPERCRIPAWITPGGVTLRQHASDVLEPNAPKRSWIPTWVTPGWVILRQPACLRCAGTECPQTIRIPAWVTPPPPPRRDDIEAACFRCAGTNAPERSWIPAWVTPGGVTLRQHASDVLRTNAPEQAAYLRLPPGPRLPSHC